MRTNTDRTLPWAVVTMAIVFINASLSAYGWTADLILLAARLKEGRISKNYKAININDIDLILPENIFLLSSGFIMFIGLCSIFKKIMDDQRFFCRQPLANINNSEVSELLLSNRDNDNFCYLFISFFADKFASLYTAILKSVGSGLALADVTMYYCISPFLPTTDPPSSYWALFTMIAFFFILPTFFSQLDVSVKSIKGDLPTIFKRLYKIGYLCFGSYAKIWLGHLSGTVLFCFENDQHINKLTDIKSILWIMKSLNWFGALVTFSDMGQAWYTLDDQLAKRSVEKEEDLHQMACCHCMFRPINWYGKKEQAFYVKNPRLKKYLDNTSAAWVASSYTIGAVWIIFDAFQLDKLGVISLGAAFTIFGLCSFFTNLATNKYSGQKKTSYAITVDNDLDQGSEDHGHSIAQKSLRLQ